MEPAKKDEKIIVGCLQAVFGIVMTPIMFILNGVILRTLWGWFVIPVFGGREIRIPEAIGLSIVAGYLTMRAAAETKKDFWVIWGSILGKYAIAILSAWIVHLFM